MSRMVTQNDPNLGVVWVLSLECVNSWLISLLQDCSLLKWASLWAISLGVYFEGGRVCLRSVSNSCRSIRHNFIRLLSVVKRNSSCQTNLKPFSSSSIFLTNCLRFFSKTCINQETSLLDFMKTKKWNALPECLLETSAPVMSRSVKFKMLPLETPERKYFLEVPSSKGKSNSYCFLIFCLLYWSANAMKPEGSMKTARNLIEPQERLWMKLR